MAGMRFKPFFVPALALVAAVSLPSCDKGKELFQSAADKVKELRGAKDEVASDYDGAMVSTVNVVNESDGKAVIMNELRLVVVEFYSDT